MRRYLLDDHLIDPEWAEREIELSRRRFASGSVGLFVARIRGTEGAMAGVAGLRPYKPGQLQILYAVDPGASGKGYATEMVAAVLDYCFDLAEMESVIATVDEPNKSSTKLVERLGFRRIGTEPGPRFPLDIFEIDAASWRRREE